MLKKIGIILLSIFIFTSCSEGVQNSLDNTDKGNKNNIIIEEEKKEATIIDVSSKNLSSTNVDITDVEYLGEKSTKINLTSEHQNELINAAKEGNFKNAFAHATLPIELYTGEIEFDMAIELSEFSHELARGFGGLAFRLQKDNETYEAIYLRGTNGTLNKPIPDKTRIKHGIQYISEPKYNFFKLRNEFPDIYEKSSDISINTWNHYKYIIKENNVSVYINNSDIPSIIVDNKFSIKTKGKLALWIDDSTNAYFKNFKITKKNDSEIIKKKVIFNFEEEKLGNIPKNWSEYFNGYGDNTSWQIENDNGNNVLSQLSNNKFNTIIFNDFSEKDLTVSVDIKRNSGKNDQGGGIILRWIDKDNYYIVRENPLEDNVVFYKMKNGTRSSLKVIGTMFGYGVDVKTLGGDWNNLKINAKGDIFTIYLNNKEIFKVQDDTFTYSGKIGLWTKSDAKSSFDNLLIN